jgi:hypothetical protein
MCSSHWIWSEGQLFHVATYKPNYKNEEFVEIHRILGEARRNSAEAKRLYAERFPSRQIPHFILNTSCELVHFYFFAYFLINPPPFTLCRHNIRSV